MNGEDPGEHSQLVAALPTAADQEKAFKTSYDQNQLYIEMLQQRAQDLESEVKRRTAVEKALREATEELERAKSELEQRVEQRTESLRDAVAQMEEFSYTVSHDLRAPLRAMKMYSEVLQTDYQHLFVGHDEPIQYLDRIADNAERLDKMILDVLAFGRVARDCIVHETVYLDKLVHELIRHYPEMQQPRASIEVAHLHPVTGHGASLAQAISNLLTNAVKFVPPDRKPHVLVWTEADAKTVRLFIKDNGIGIPPKHQHRLFNLFERIHPDLPFEGTGVGLAIVRKAMERMRGLVGVESDGYNGSLFWIQLPSQQAHE